MTEASTNGNAQQFAGLWIGETQGCESPAHIWQITVKGPSVAIDNLWEGEVSSRRMWGQIAPGSNALFQVGRFQAILVDAQHFIIPGWDTKDARGHVGPDYDVVFSRPGIPELMATRVWEEWQERERQGEGVTR